MIDSPNGKRNKRVTISQNVILSHENESLVCRPEVLRAYVCKMPFRDKEIGLEVMNTHVDTTEFGARRKPVWA